MGIDTVRSRLRPAKLDFQSFDLRSPDVWQLLGGVDTVVHLAFSREPSRNVNTQHELNVAGFRNVLDAAQRAGVSKFVYGSSGYVYGAHADNPGILGEDDPMRPNAGLAAAEQHADNEAWLSDWVSKHPETQTTVLRFGRMVGPDVGGSLSRALAAQRFPTVAGYRPPQQVLHPDDAAGALVQFTLGDHRGVFNVCADDAVAIDEILQRLDKPALELPGAAAVPIRELAWKLRVSDIPAAEIEYMMFPTVMANDRARSQGWVPKYSSEETFQAAIASLRDRADRGEPHFGRLRSLATRWADAAIGSAVAAYNGHRSRKRARLLRS